LRKKKIFLSIFYFWLAEPEDNKGSKKRRQTTFYMHIESDDIDKMAERAEKNQMFMYVKIPEVSVTVSYKVCVMTANHQCYQVSLVERQNSFSGKKTF
jgi:hypothetical protein